MERFKTIIVILVLMTNFSYSQTVIDISEQTSADTLLKSLLGVISGPDPCPHSVAPDLTPHLHDIGITSIRNNGYFDDRLDMELMFRCPDTTTYPSWRCDPDDPNNYDWYLSDLQFQSYLDGGFEPFFRVGGEHQCDTRLHDYNGPRDALEESNWIQAAIHVVHRYNNWNGQENVLNYLDIWTEFPNVDFWDRTNQEFFKFWADAYEALKAEFPQLKIGGPGFLVSLPVAYGQVQTGKGKVPVDFIYYLYRRKIRPDWIGWHLFDNRPENFYYAAKNYRHLLEGSGLFSQVPWAGTGFFDGVELICDAYMTCSMVVDSSGNVYYLSREEDFKRCNKQMGAAITTAIWSVLQYTDTEKAYYYRCGDPDSKPVSNAYHPDASFITGLFYGDSSGTYKPLAHAVRFWSTLCREYLKLLSTGVPLSESIDSKLWVLAAEKNSNNYALLVSNIGEETRQFSIILKGDTLKYPDYNAQYAIVNDDEDGRTFYSWEGGNFSIEGENVMLVEITANQTSVKGSKTNATSSFKLEPNYPNPFNAQTTISYNLPEKALVTLKIFDVRGRQVRTLVRNDKPTGNHAVVWDGKDELGNDVGSGVYFYQLKIGKKFSQTKKLLLLR